MQWHEINQNNLIVRKKKMTWQKQKKTREEKEKNKKKTKRMNEMSKTQQSFNDKTLCITWKISTN
jgi:sortase (surface protein transpeptidase)